MKTYNSKLLLRLCLSWHRESCCPRYIEHVIPIFITSEGRWWDKIAFDSDLLASTLSLSAFPLWYFYVDFSISNGYGLRRFIFALNVSLEFDPICTCIKYIQIYSVASVTWLTWILYYSLYGLYSSDALLLYVDSHSLSPFSPLRISPAIFPICVYMSTR